MSSVFSFGTSDAEGSASEILSVQAAMIDTMDAIGQSVDKLRPDWVSSESDQYQEIISKWQEGAAGIRDILKDVSETLTAVKDGNTELRKGIDELLQQIT